MRLGILGGTFNPIHQGHVRMAAYFKEKLSLDEVRLIPTNIPSHKEASDLLSGMDRINLCKLAVAGMPGICVSDMEVRRGGISRTAETVDAILEETPGADLFLLMGGDMFLTIQDWSRYEELADLCTICVLPRRKGEREALLNHGKTLTENGAIIFIGDLEEMEISSSEIREKIKQKERVDIFLSPKEAAYLMGCHLYQELPQQLKNDQVLVAEMEKEKRAHHSKCVAAQAAFLAALYDEPVEKAYIAGLLHDVLRSLSPKEQLQMVRKSDIILTDTQKRFPAVWHGLLAAVYLKEKGLVEDKAILSAIGKHTIGGSSMTAFDKILYCADATSFDRDYPGVEQARKRAEESLLGGFQYAVSGSIMMQMTREEPILEETFWAYNENTEALSQSSGGV